MWRALFLFFLISFAGWCMEMVYCALFHAPSDRGFLHLPLCPIYGSAVALCFLLLGTPKRFRLPVRNLFLRIVLYWLAASLLATGLEFFVGLFFDKVVHLRLWSYASYPLYVSDYVFLPLCAVWGLLLTFFLGVCLEPLDAVIRRIPTYFVRGIDSCLLFLALGECCLRIFLHFSGK